MKTALVSGDQGFVARHLIPILIDHGYEVTGFDIKGKPGDRTETEHYVSNHGLDARDYFRHTDQTWDLVVPLAAVVQGRKAIEQTPLDLAVDLAIDSEMIQWAKRVRLRKLVLFSSSAAYPAELQSDKSDDPLWEGDIDLYNIQQPDPSIYGLAKIVLEQLAKYAQADGLNVLVVRPFSLWAEDQDRDYPMPSFLDRARARVDPFPIWGSGRQSRDWLHVDDACEALMTAIEQNIQGPINLCSGIGTTFDELAKMCCEIVGYEPTLEHLPTAPTGVFHRVGNPTKMHTFYKPTMSLREHLERVLSENTVA